MVHIMSTAKLKLLISEKKNEIPKAGYDCCLDQTSIYLLKVDNGNTRGLRKICSKSTINNGNITARHGIYLTLTIKTSKQH